MKVFHVMIPPELETKLIKLYFGKKRTNDPSVEKSFDDWLQQFILDLLKEFLEQMEIEK